MFDSGIQVTILQSAAVPVAGLGAQLCSVAGSPPNFVAFQSIWRSSELKLRHLVAAMRNSAVRPDATSFRTLLYGLDHANKWQQTLAMMSGLKAHRAAPGKNLGMNERSTF